MKKITILLSILMVYSYTLHAQVGVKSENPEQVFHIDPANNTIVSDPATKTDDVVITSEGIVGIGTATPDTDKKLHVVGNVKVSGNTILKDTAIIEGIATADTIGVNTANPTANLHVVNMTGDAGVRLADGSQSSGHLLTADRQGRAFWDGLRPMSSIVRGALLDSIAVGDNPDGRQPVSITGDSLSLAPGRWLIVAKSAIAGSNIGGYYMYMRLYAETGFKGRPATAPQYVDGVFLTATGSSAEQRGGSAFAATPNLMYIVSVPTKSDPTLQPGTREYNTTFWIELVSSRNSMTSSAYGAMEFYALRIDRQD